MKTENVINIIGGMAKHTLCSALVGLFIVVRAVDAHGQDDSLASYLEIAEQNNPGVQAALTLYKANLEKITQAAALEDPTLDVGFAVPPVFPPMETVDGRQIMQVQVMQMFPWFGTRKAARAEMEHMARMTYEQYRETREQLRFDVYTQWVTLGRLNQQLNNNRENKLLLLQLEELALRRFAAPDISGGSQSGTISGGAVSSPAQAGVAPAAAAMGGGMGGMPGMGGGVSPTPSSQQSSAGAGAMVMGAGDGGMASMGGGGMSNVLRIHIEIAEIDNNIENILSDIQAESARFNALLGRSVNSELRIPDTLIQARIIFDEAAVMKLVSAQNPTIGMLEAEERALTAKIDMDRRMSYPMIGVGLQYNINIKRDHPLMGMEDMNGKDMFMPMVSVSLPIFRGKYRARVRENELTLQSHCELLANTINMIEAELHGIRSRLDNAERRIALYRRQSELAGTMYSLTLQEFVTGRSDLSGVIQAQRQLLDLRLMSVEAVADYNIMAAQVRKLVVGEW